MNKYGIENLEEITWMEDPKMKGQNHGSALLELTSHQCAMVAFKRLQKQDVVFGYERTAKVAFTESSSQVDEEIMTLLHN